MAKSVIQFMMMIIICALRDQKEDATTAKQTLHAFSGLVPL